MGFKADELRDGCFAKARDDEPMFVLLGRDPLASDKVEQWAKEAEAIGTRPEKVAEARECAKKMRAYADQHARLPDKQLSLESVRERFKPTVELPPGTISAVAENGEVLASIPDPR